MGLAEIEALINSMDTPQNIVKNADTIGLWGVATLWGLFLVVLFATRTRYERFSYSFSVASFITFIVATLLASVSLITAKQLLYFITLLVLSVIYLYLEERGVFPEKM